jgi:hypothetical protein
MTLGQMYRARIRESTTVVYSTDEVGVKYELLALEDAPSPPSGIIFPGPAAPE